MHFDERYFSVNQACDIKKMGPPSSGLSTKTLNRLDIVRIIIAGIAAAILSASFLMEIMINLSWESVVKCIIKLAVTIFFGIIGMVSGYQFTSIKEVAEMNACADEIDTFKKWCEGNSGIN